MIRDQDAVFDQVLNSLVVQCHLPVTGKVFEVGFDDGRTLPYNRFHHSPLVVRRCLALNNRDRSLRAGSDACPEPVTEEVGDKPRFSFDDLEGPLRAVRDALAASRAFRFIDSDNLAFHVVTP
jgi:hypothetical protein